MNRGLTRRHFLQAAAGTLALTLLNLHRGESQSPGQPDAPQSPNSPGNIEYRGVEDIYRKKWTWDRVVRGTHHSNCGYQRCAWNVYVKDDIVWREEQVAHYPQTNPDLPDFNPRGCQKGVCYSDRMYDQARLKVPLKRAGARGEGKWTRISWDQALTEIADKFIDAMISKEHGPGSIYWDLFEVQTPECWRTIGADNQNGGTTDGWGVWGAGGGSTFFEIGHPLDSDDDLHDLSAALGERIVVHLLGIGCDATSSCATPAELERRVFLESESFVFLGDFESGDLAGWSAGVPGPRGDS